MHSALSPELIAAIETGVHVIAPNQRSAHALRLLYANHAVSAGRKTWVTPDIRAFDAFVGWLWRKHGTHNERLLTTEQCKLLWERIVTTSSWSSSLLSPQAAANASFRSWERMQAWGIGRTDLLEQVSRLDSIEARALLEWHDHFVLLCKEREWLPVTLLPQCLLSVDLKIPGLNLVVVGNAELMPSQRTLLDHLTRCGAVVTAIGNHHDQGEATVACCETTELELHAAAHWAQRQLMNGAQSVAVAVSGLDECAAQVRRAFSEVLAQPIRTLSNHPAHGAQHQASFAIATYRRLAEFPVARAALDVLQLCVGHAGSALIGGTLRSPFLKGNSDEASQRALADIRIRSNAREHYDLANLEAIVGHAGCPTFHAACRDARTTLQSQPSRMQPSAAAEIIAALWRGFGWPGERSLDSDDQQIVTRAYASLAEFGALDELLGPVSFVNAVHHFEQLLRNTRFEPRSAPALITVLDADSIDGLRTDALWIAGMDESRWPPPANPDPFIPLPLQVQTGMPNATATQAREQARRRFATLRTLARSVVFSWAQHDNDVEILPSPWLRDLPKLSSFSIDTSGRYATRIFAAKPALDVLVESRGPSLIDGVARGGSRIFELQAQCPFRAYAELRLNAKRLDEVVPNVDARQRGTLLHAALADIWRVLKDSAGLHSQSGAQLESLVHTALARHAAPLLEGASTHRIRMLQIEQELASERILALLSVDRLRAPFKVAGHPETAERLSVGALHFELRLDRIDELTGDMQRGERVIVDYKTGNTVSTRSWTHDRPEQPQLPLYAVTHPTALAAVAFATLGARGVGYEGVARTDGILPDIKAFDKALPLPHQSWNGLQDYWRGVIGNLADEFAAGSAQVDPLPVACRHCHLSTLCRVHERKIQLEAEDVE